MSSEDLITNFQIAIGPITSLWRVPLGVTDFSTLSAYNYELPSLLSLDV